MSASIDQYAEVAGQEVVDQLRQLAAPLRGMRVVNVNSARRGGGVAQILERLVPLMGDLGIDARWEVVTGDLAFFQCTKALHNALQGNPVAVSRTMLDAYERTNAHNAEALRDVLEPADVVFVHDPQPAPLLALLPDRKGRWIWRCHVDASHPHRPVWKYLRDFVALYDASVFSLLHGGTDRIMLG